MKDLWDRIQRVYTPRDSFKKVGLMIAIPWGIALGGGFSGLFILWVVGIILQIFLIVLIVLGGRNFFKNQHS